MARASADERWAYYSRRGNESLHKASMCLAGGRFDHALAFIAQAKGAFTAIGDADKLSFLQVSRPCASGREVESNSP